MSNTEHLYNVLAEKLGTIQLPNSSDSLLTARVVDSISFRNKRIAISWVPTPEMSAEYIKTCNTQLQEHLTKHFPDTRVHIAASAHHIEPDQNTPDTTNLAPAPRLRTRPQWLQSTRIIAVGAGKGGVGKSSITYALAKTLKHQDKSLRIGVLDADIYGPSIPTLLESDGAVIPSQALLSAVEHAGISFGSFGFTANKDEAAVWRGPMAHKALKHLIENVTWPQLDVLLIDLPPGTGDVPISLHKLLTLDSALLVTTPHVLAQADTARAQDMFTRLGVKLLGCVRNMTHINCPSCKTHIDLFAKDNHCQDGSTLPKFDVPYTNKPLSIDLTELVTHILSGNSITSRRA